MSTTEEVGGAIGGPASGGGSVGAGANVDHVLQIRVCVRAILAEKEMDIASILEIVQGTIIEFDRGFDQDINLHVSDRPVAKGHVVKVGEDFGLRVTSICSVEDRIQAMGPRG